MMRPSIAIVTGAVLGAAVAVILAVGFRPADPAPVPAPVPVMVQLPPCDDDAPGRPVTGPCWLSDEDRVWIYPYPYASAPMYVLNGSQGGSSD
jgi:hypothetical protein